MSGHIASAKREDWNTPPEIIAAVHRALGGPPELDPCSNANSVVGARRTICRPDDGLMADWTAASIFVNPPFGKGIAKWVGRCVLASQMGSQVVLLVPAAVDTRHWQGLIFPTSDAICFLRGRVRFIGAKAAAPFATAIIGWRCGVAFEEAFGRLGSVVPGGEIGRFLDGSRTKGRIGSQSSFLPEVG